jgi:hypothetical protein
MARRKQGNAFVRGTAAHRRTEGDYMGVLLDSVTLDDWRDVVTGALRAAKEGDASARAWLAQYLVGKPVGAAPTPLTIVVRQLNGVDPIVERLANPAIERMKYPSLHQHDDWEDGIKAQVAAELAQNLPNPETIETPALARVSGEFDAK